ncbi:MAG: DJ-1 family glyoxalase III [Myxococcota bacterium]
MTSILIPIADGSEEIEAVTLINVLRRAGFDVTVASVSQLEIKGARQIKLTADKKLEECQHESFDGIFLPGGMPGATNLAACEPLIAMLKKHAGADKYYGAICASPAVVLAANGLLDGKKATTYPGFEAKLPDQTCAQERVVADGNCITAQSPGSAQEFALRIIAHLAGEGKSKEIRGDLC